MEIDIKEVEHLASLGARNGEIAAMMGISRRLLVRRCKAELKKARATMRVRLRGKQLTKALDGDSRLLTWLGQHELRQGEKDAARAEKEPVKKYIAIEVDKV